MTNIQFKKTSEILTTIYYSIEANEEKRDAFNSHYCEFTERMKGMILADSVDEIRAKRSRRNRK